ncbi:MAG: SAM-dependent methyltransferase [Marinilabiliales bacterium]|nr:MAG: SAM-dependent methyltransferase [Marinilabiliales bacterium]
MHNNNCITCGAELVYTNETRHSQCVICGKDFEVNVTCSNGHYICDTCHSHDSGELIRTVCAGTSQTDPVLLADQIMKMPALKMHGPEHHILVPAVLVATYCNITGREKERAALVATAVKRSSVIPGGFCGFQGACGAGIGTGVAVSVVTGSTPVATKSWSLSNKMTAGALNVIADHGGPRCCKRDVFLAIRYAAEFFQRHFDVHIPVSEPQCSFSALNRECRQKACPFYVHHS